MQLLEKNELNLYGLYKKLHNKAHNKWKCTLCTLLCMFVFSAGTLEKVCRCNMTEGKWRERAKGQK